MARKYSAAVWRACLAMLWLAALFPGSAPASARGMPGSVPITVCLARVDLTPAEAFAAPARFDCRTPQVAWGSGDTWALSRPIAGLLQHEPLIVRQYAIWQTRLTMWARYADGAVLQLRATRDSGSVGTGIEHVLPARGAAPVQLLWRVEGAANTRGLVVGAHLLTPADQARRNADGGMMVGWFAGLCVGFLFINLVLFAVLRRQFLLAYCAMVAGLLLYVVADAGLVHRFIRDFGSIADLKLTSLTFTLCVVGGLWFARSFLEPEVVGARLTWFNRAVIGLLLLAALIQGVLPPWQMGWIDQPQGVAFLLAIVALGALGWRAWTRRSAHRWIWASTACVPLMLAGMRTANSFPMLGTLFAMGGSLMAIMAGGMFASSLAIAYRIRLVVRERDEARAREIAARLLADTDPLTGLLNRRAFLRQAIGREDEQMLMLADIDHFKHVNDCIGHDGGDEVLRVMARALEAAVPPGALVARMGGEEFAILAPASLGVDPADVLARVRAARMPYDLEVTVSLGVCLGTLAREVDWKAMYRDTDRALFAAKAAGRDRARRAQVLAAAA